jgi:hypothetical protein
MALWNIVYYVLGIGSVICSIVSTLVQSQLRTPLALIAGASTGTLLLLKPQTNAIAYARAWVLLDAACMEYELGSNANIQLLLDAIKKGEDIIDRDAES